MKKSMLAVAIAFSVMVAAPARAQLTNPSAGPGWQFEFQPYLWAPGLHGDSSINNAPKAQIDMSPKDVIQKLDFGLMGMFEARNGRWGLVGDAFYAKLSDSADKTFSLHPRVGGVDVNVGLKLKQHIYALAGEYRLVEGTTPVDLMLGARYNNIDMDAKVGLQGLGPLGLSRKRTFTYDKDWVDPYVGLRFVHPLADKWSLLGYGDVGGAGIGAASKFTYQLMGGVIYDYSKTVSFKAGYRQYHINYDHGGFEYDVNQRGFIAALGIKF